MTDEVTDYVELFELNRGPRFVFALRATRWMVYWAGLFGRHSFHGHIGKQVRP